MKLTVKNLVFFISFVFLFTAFFIPVSASLKPPSTVWEKTYSSEHNFEICSVVETPFEEYIFCGTNVNNHENKSIVVFKTDLDGNEVWLKNIKITEQATCTKAFMNPDNTVTIVGNYICEDSNKWSFCFINITRDGDILWEKSIGSDRNQFSYAAIMAFDSSFVITGYKDKSSDGNQSLYICNVSQNGTLLWENTFDYSLNEIGKDLLQLFDENLLIIGESISKEGVLNIFVTKLDRSGKFLWKQILESSHSYSANSIILANDYGYLITGETDAYSDKIGIYLTKIDETGKKQWEKYYDNATSALSRDIIPTNQDGYMIAGATNVTIEDVLNKNGNAHGYVLYVDSHGNKLSEQIFGKKGHDAFLHVKRAADLGFLLVGRSASYNPNNRIDGYVVKLEKIFEDRPVLYTNSSTISFGVVEKNQKGSKKYITLENGGEGVLSGFISTSDRWITTSDRSFMIPTFGSLQIIIGIETNDLLEGRYQGEIYLTSNGGDSKIYVYVIVIDNSPIISLVPDILDFGLIRERENVSASFRILNKGRTNLYGKIKSETDWLQLEKDYFYSNDITIPVTLNPKQLKNGLQTGTLVIDSNGGVVKYNVRVLCGFPVVIIRITIGNSVAQVNGVNHPIDEDNTSIVPFILHGRTMVPIRFISESFGAKVSWNNEEKSTTITIPDRDMEIVLYVDQKKAIVNQTSIEMDVEPLIYQDRLFVPIRFVAEAFLADIRFFKPEDNSPPYIVISFEK